MWILFCMVAAQLLVHGEFQNSEMSNDMDENSLIQKYSFVASGDGEIDDDEDEDEEGVVVTEHGYGESAESRSVQRPLEENGFATLQHLAKDASTTGKKWEDARPGTCCDIEPTTVMTWSNFKNSAVFEQGLADGAIVVPCGHEVTVDESFGEAHEVGLQVQGSLKFEDGNDITLTFSYVFVCGRFTVGTASQPHQSKLEIILRKGEENFEWHGKNFGKAPFVTFGGDLQITGAQCGEPTWTRLRETVEPTVDSGINIARAGTAVQSSLAHAKKPAGRGIDGNYHWKHGTVETIGEMNPFWSLTLENNVPKRIQKVIVEDSQRSLEDATVLVSTAPCEKGALCPGVPCTDTGRNVRNIRRYKFREFDCAGHEGSYVHVQIEANVKLKFSEAEVYEAMTSGTYDLPIQTSPTVSWQVGDEIVIAPSGRDSSEYDHELTVVSVAAGTIQVAGEMAHTHHGCDTTDPACWQSAEVASLSRNVIIKGANDCDDTNCGHFMIAHTNEASVCGVKFHNLGQKEVEGRYPLHVHMAGDAPGVTLSSNVLTFNRNRGIVLHGTMSATVDSNVIYNSNGHLVMLEDAIEMHNEIRNNLAMDPEPQVFGCLHGHDQSFTCPSRGDHAPNAFWISNPNNIFENNVGIAPGAAFFIETRHVFGKSRTIFGEELKRPPFNGNGKVKGRVPLGSFKNNLAHSSDMGMGNYPRMSHSDNSPVVYEGFTAWSCREGQEARGDMFHFINSRLINNQDALVSGFVDKIKVFNSQLQGNERRSRKRVHRTYYPIVSAPMVIKAYALSSEDRIKGDFVVDEATKNWALQHGNYDWCDMKIWAKGDLGVLFNGCTD